MKCESRNGYFMIYHEEYLYFINESSVSKNQETACEVVSKITDNDKSVKIISYNGNNYNYDVNGILVNRKIAEKIKSKKTKEYMLVRETPEMYQTFMSRIRPKAPNWVKNILNGTAEGEIIYHKTADYYLMPDFKWDHNPSRIYLLVLFTNKQLRSIRDLNSSHVEMLMKTRSEVLDYIETNYHIPESKLRMYFHYHPSAWQLHLHVQHIDSPITSSFQSSKAITLSDILVNLELVPDYYSKATLECILSKTNCKKYYD
jgi:hypothetical protein